MTYSFLAGRYLMSAHPRFSLRRVSGILSVRVNLCSRRSLYVGEGETDVRRPLSHGLVP